MSGPTRDSFDNLILQSNIEEDLRSKCFICDLQAHEFDRKAKVWSWTIMILHWMFSFYYTFSGISKSCSARSQHVELCVLLLAHGFNRYQWPQCYTKICIRSCKSIYTSIPHVDKSEHYYEFHTIVVHIVFQIKESKIDFFPQENALCFDPEEDQTGLKLGQIQHRLDTIEQMFKVKVLE